MNKKILMNLVLSTFVGAGLVVLSGLEFPNLGNVAGVVFGVGAVGFFGYKQGWFNKK